MNKIYILASIMVLCLIACADVQEVFSDVDKKIDDFKEENNINKKLDEISDEANKGIDRITH